MKARIEYLRRRRESLVERAAAQRSEVSSVALHLQQRLWPVDMGFAIVQAMRKHPTVAVASAALLLRAPRNKLFLWSGRLLTVWEFFYFVRKQWRAVR
jgi:hypothetical protein